MDFVDEKVNKAFSITQSMPKMTMFLTAFVQLFLIVYSAHIAQRLPKDVQLMFMNSYFRFAVFFLILYLSKYSPSTAILVAIAFVLSINYINTGRIEFMENVIPVGTSGPMVPMVITESLVLTPSSAQIEAQNQKMSCFDSRKVNMGAVNPLVEQEEVAFGLAPQMSSF